MTLHEVLVLTLYLNLLAEASHHPEKLTDDERYATMLSSRLVHDVDDALHILDLQLCASTLFRGFVVMIALKRNASQYFREDLHPNCLVEERSLGKLVSGAQA